MTLTGRAAVLGIVLLVLGSSFAYPLRNWFGQRAEIADLRAQTLAQQQSVTDLQREIARWNDPAYVRTVARERLHFVLPGETLYVVLDDDSTTPAASQAITAAGGEWWQRLWTSVEQADGAEVPSDAPAEVPGGAPTARPTGTSFGTPPAPGSAARSIPGSTGGAGG